MGKESSRLKSTNETSLIYSDKLKPLKIKKQKMYSKHLDKSYYDLFDLNFKNIKDKNITKHFKERCLERNIKCDNVFQTYSNGKQYFIIDDVTTIYYDFFPFALIERENTFITIFNYSLLAKRLKISNYLYIIFNKHKNNFIFEL